MPRNSRIDIGNEIFHVINRSNGRLKIFNKDSDYKLFEEILTDTKEIMVTVPINSHLSLLTYSEEAKH